MGDQLEDNVAIDLPRGTLLVIFEFLARSYDSWRENHHVGDESTFVLQKPDSGEKTALWHLEGAIERTLPEIFSSEYRNQLDIWKQRLTSS